MHVHAESLNDKTEEDVQQVGEGRGGLAGGRIFVYFCCGLKFRIFFLARLGYLWAFCGVGQTY